MFIRKVTNPLLSHGEFDALRGVAGDDPAISECVDDELAAADEVINVEEFDPVGRDKNPATAASAFFFSCIRCLRLTDRMWFRLGIR